MVPWSIYYTSVLWLNLRAAMVESGGTIPW